MKRLFVKDDESPTIFLMVSEAIIDPIKPVTVPTIPRCEQSLSLLFDWFP